ncbi:hypothetical protein V6N12_007425 [Hibiscus sabdariffa]|uniref:Uncharacterized protein n=1 Tax=Hibiscus sabdariffa TaxID=183260 RepID=A0ABR2F1R7_9ROSI
MERFAQTIQLEIHQGKTWLPDIGPLEDVVVAGIPNELLELTAVDLAIENGELRFQHFVVSEDIVVQALCAIISEDCVE